MQFALEPQIQLARDLRMREVVATELSDFHFIWKQEKIWKIKKNKEKVTAIFSGKEERTEKLKNVWMTFKQMTRTRRR